MFALLAILLVIALLGGGYGHSRVGYVGWSPAGVILVVFLFMAVTGRF